MITSLVLAKILGIIMLVGGISVLNKKHFSVVWNELENNRALLWIFGFIALVLGAFVLSFYSTWSTNWRVLITIIGWLSLIKGIIVLIWPHWTIRMYSKWKTEGVMALSGIVAIIIGLLFLYASLLT